MPNCERCNGRPGSRSYEIRESMTNTIVATRSGANGALASF